MANEVLGKCACPLCGYAAQDVKKSNAKNPKPYLNCDECGVQIFTRQAKSVKILTARMTAEKPAAVAIGAPAPVKTPEAIKPATLDAPEPVTPVEEQPKPEKTIFDFFS